MEERGKGCRGMLGQPEGLRGWTEADGAKDTGGELHGTWERVRSWAEFAAGAVEALGNLGRVYTVHVRTPLQAVAVCLGFRRESPSYSHVGVTMPR